eukprot:Skav207998  [mRNA]  locus=scaffold1203:171078:179398:+ [translate_table: standard]
MASNLPDSGLLPGAARELVQQLTQRKKSGGGVATGELPLLLGTAHRRRRQARDFKLVSGFARPGATGRGGKGQGKGKDDKAIARIARAAKYKQKALAKEEKDAEENKYRDRASLRRDMKGEYEAGRHLADGEKVAAEFENHGEVSVEQSKYLGGDLEHTHLVKGLDFLLNKVRAELNKQKKVEEVQRLVEELAGDCEERERVQKMGKAIAQGHRIRNAPTMFLPGRMAYEFDTELEKLGTVRFTSELVG